MNNKVNESREWTEKVKQKTIFAAIMETEYMENNILCFINVYKSRKCHSWMG